MTAAANRQTQKDYYKEYRASEEEPGGPTPSSVPTWVDLFINEATNVIRLRRIEFD